MSGPLRLAYHPLYSDGISAEARFPRRRYRLVREGLAPLVEAGQIELIEPSPVSNADLLRVHDPDYVEAFFTGRLSPAAMRRIGLRPWTEHFAHRTRVLVGGTLAALDALVAGAPAAGNLAGGTHHAHRDKGGGYCVFNDLAVAAALALDVHGYERVFVVDLDVHHGDGTASIFADDPRVTTLSVHGRKNYPAQKPPSDYDLALEDETSDADYLAHLERLLPRLLSAHQPDLILFQAGVDALAEDRLGRLSLTRAGLAARNALVLSQAALHRSPLLIAMGGGYGEPLEASIAAHVDVYRQAAESVHPSG